MLRIETITIRFIPTPLACKIEPFCLQHINIRPPYLPSRKIVNCLFRRFISYLNLVNRFFSSPQVAEKNKCFPNLRKQTYSRRQALFQILEGTPQKSPRQPCLLKLEKCGVRRQETATTPHCDSKVFSRFKTQ